MFPKQRAAFVSKSHYFLKSLYFFFSGTLDSFKLTTLQQREDLTLSLGIIVEKRITGITQTGK